MPKMLSIEAYQKRVEDFEAWMAKGLSTAQAAKKLGLGSTSYRVAKERIESLSNREAKHFDHSSHKSENARAFTLRTTPAKGITQSEMARKLHEMASTLESAATVLDNFSRG